MYKLDIKLWQKVFRYQLQQPFQKFICLKVLISPNYKFLRKYYYIINVTSNDHKSKQVNDVTDPVATTIWDKLSA